jgi:hypothetical protein
VIPRHQPDASPVLRSAQRLQHRVARVLVRLLECVHRGDPAGSVLGIVDQFEEHADVGHAVGQRAQAPPDAVFVARHRE